MRHIAALRLGRHVERDGKDAVALCQESSIQEFREGSTADWDHTSKPRAVFWLRIVCRAEVNSRVGPVGDATTGDKPTLPAEEDLARFPGDIQADQPGHRCLLTTCFVNVRIEHVHFSLSLFSLCCLPFRRMSTLTYYRIALCNSLSV